ncbi:hypothetical protein IHE44_0002738 [Lamprotornis superbus]|uniref:Uncharacterized protein n=1 Tax=Lamprotornis superbus TaxID=245042 RepID=A0A835U2E1_9PASS|nr:hypothetical protein IHE44_0002738 [Lamprotornis superbus]
MSDGFCRFFGRHGSEAAEQSSTIGNAIMAAAAGIGMAGLAFLLIGWMLVLRQWSHAPVSKLGALMPVKCCKSIVLPPSLAACGPVVLPFERVLLGEKSTQWAADFLSGKLISPAAGSASLWLAVATLLLLATGPWGRRAAATASGWTEQCCAGWP